jgi:hypothetical protein
MNIGHKRIFLTSPKLLQRGFGKGGFENNSEGSFETNYELWGPKNDNK